MRHGIDIGSTFYHITNYDPRHRRFICLVITGSDEKFWHTARNGFRVNKRSQKLSLPYGGSKATIYTTSQIKQMLWIENNTAQILRKVDRARDYNMLRLIGKAVGYCPGIDDIEIPN